MGGNPSPNNPFLLKNVCSTCNSASGRYIDGPFIRSWFIQNSRSQNARQFVDLNRDPIIPLTFMGELRQTWLADTVCDLWLGPTGDIIYHFHNPYPKYKGADPHSGPPLYLRANEIDPGFAFIFVRASNPVWHRCIIFSFVEHFEDSTLYLGNGPTPPGGRFSDIPFRLSALHTQLKAMGAQWHNVTFAIGTDFGHRFMAKLALGMGALFLNDSFLKSNEAKRLRDFMWEKDPDARGDIQIAGTTFLSQSLLPVARLVGWSEGHVILMIPIDGKLILAPIFYGEQSASIVVSSDQDHWAGKVDIDGTLFAVVPGLRKYCGPISVGEFLDVKFNGALTPVELVQLFAEVNQIGALPPYD